MNDSETKEELKIFFNIRGYYNIDDIIELLDKFIKEETDYELCVSRNEWR